MPPHSDLRSRLRPRRLVVTASLSAMILLVVGLVAMNQSSATDQVAPRTTTVRAVTRDLTKTLSATGTVKYEDQRAIPYLAAPPAPVPGAGTGGGGGQSQAAPPASTGAGATGPSSTTTTQPRAAAGTTASSVPASRQQGAGTGQTPTGGQGQAQSQTPTTAPVTTTTTRPPTTTTTAPTTSTTAGSTSGGPLAAAGQGGTRHVLTWMPELGSTIERNQPLFRVDNQPTYLFFGVVPAYRQLDGSSTAGLDIGQLQKNLIDLGFGDGVTVSGIYDTATYYAVARWETSQGLDGDGLVQIGEIAFAPGTARITGEPTAVGSDVQSGASIVTASSVTKVVATTVDARQVDVVKPDQPVDIKLPDQTVVTGKVTDVGSVATATGGTASSSSGPTPSTLPVTVGFDDPATSDSLPDDAQVNVSIRVELHAGVVAVPVAAVVPGDAGQPSVLLTDTGARVPVTTGIAADAMVELTNPPGSIHDGTSLTIPA